MTFSGAGLLALFGGYKWSERYIQPDIAYLHVNKPLISALAETIIPRTDLPGATDAGVADYILLIMEDCCNEKNQQRFINGLKDVQKDSWSQFGKAYEHCTAHQQEQLLRDYAQDASHAKGLLARIRDRLAGKPFFYLLKEYTVEGYCTSEAGATQALAYLYIPGHYDPCTTLAPDQHSWAIN